MPTLLYERGRSDREPARKLSYRAEQDQNRRGRLGDHEFYPGAKGRRLVPYSGQQGYRRRREPEPNPKSRSVTAVREVHRVQDQGREEDGQQGVRRWVQPDHGHEGRGQDRGRRPVVQVSAMPLEPPLLIFRRNASTPVGSTNSARDRWGRDRGRRRLRGLLLDVSLRIVRSSNAQTDDSPNPFAHDPSYT